ncbi:hypothetical protein M436DRAFT_57235 [Aureobasidium namibiae CBS 147.97]|uniref:Zn(2)-C6 fungal-type domain-containing protein n=1 Tax=Aureobasidium namibiae CBS 147.97 TaxID=1043004 RepID=A0A074WGB1_9PEZI
MGKRNRACEECHRLKIKCDVNTSQLKACERCSRNGLECVPAAPRLQRDRINQLEAQIEQLKLALSDQSSNDTPSRSPEKPVEDQNQYILSYLDARVSLRKQQDLLYFFRHQVSAVWPVVRISMDLDQIRVKSPILLMSVLAFTCTHNMQGTDLEVHDDLVRETMRVLGDEVIGRGQRSIELVQALLLSAFWSKNTRKGQQASCYQVVQLAVDMAIDLGIAGFAWQPSPAAYFCRLEDATSLEGRRTWLACYVALSTCSVDMRRLNAVPWDAHLQECLSFLESTGEALDLLLCQIVRITQLIQVILGELHLFRLATFVDGNEYGTHSTMENLKNKVDAWTTQLPPLLATSSTLRVLRHVAMVHIYEVVLHTQTNKPSFAAPYIPARIPVKDFPTPINMIPPLRSALEALVHHCHAVIDSATNMDPALVLSLPTFSFAPTVVYSLFVLVTTLAASTSPGNTYGQCLIRDHLQIEQCGAKLRRLTGGMRSLDPTMSCWTSRLFDATGWLEEWYNDYATILHRYEAYLTI